MTDLDDGVAIYGVGHTHTIVAQDGGVIEMDDLVRITGPSDNERLIVNASDGTIKMPSLHTITGTTGRVNINVSNRGLMSLGNVTTRISTDIVLDGASTLYSRALRAGKATTITLNDPHDLLDIGGDFDLDTTITVVNPGDSMFALGGDFSYAHTDGPKVPLGNSYVFLNGQGPQELEIGGRDVWVLTDEHPDDSFGFGQMIIGDPNLPTAVLLIDAIDNGHRGGFGGEAEALYLFGKDGQDGLRILGGSTLYLNGLNVYAELNGEITDLNTLFGPDETKIRFGENGSDGWISKGSGPELKDPANLSQNGGFETGNNPPTVENSSWTLAQGSEDIDHWQISWGTMNWTHESMMVDAGPGQRFADLSSETGQGAVSQAISTVPGRLYHVWFDLGANPLGILDNDSDAKVLRVSAADSAEEILFDVANLSWHKKTWRFVATEVSTTLTFANANTDSNSAFGVAIDNVVVVDAHPNDIPTRRLNLTIKGNGLVTAQSVDQTENVQGPGEFNWSFEVAEEVILTAEGKDFARWRGDIGDNDPQSRDIKIFMDNNLSIQADFMDLTVQIANIDTSGCSLLQATVLVTDPDANDAAVIDLTQANFSLYENGVKQSIQTVLQGTCSVAFCLVLDYSGGMYEWPDIVPGMEAAAKALLSQMTNPEDIGEVIKFSEEIGVMQEFTHDRGLLLGVIDPDPPFRGKGTALYDALYKAITDTSEQAGCRAVVAMSDWLDIISDRSKEEVIEYAQEKNVPIIAVLLKQALTGDGEDVAREIAKKTGGLFYDAGDSSSTFEDVYGKIADALNNQYTITYKAVGCGPENDESLDHELEIIVIGNDLAYGSDVDLFKCPPTCVSN